MKAGRVFAVVFLAILLMAVSPYLPVGIDWHNTYRPAALAMLQGKSPFSIEIYYAAPWALVPLMPFAVMPYWLGRLGVFILGLCAFAFTAYRLGARNWNLVIFMMSAAVIGCLNNGNIEWMPLLGIVLPPQYGLILLAVKPQLGVGLGVYWLITIWKDKGFWQMTRTFAPVLLLILASVALYGFWFLRFEQTVAWSRDNTSLGLQGMFIGAVALVWSIHNHDDRTALAAGPFLAPYVLQFTWSATLTPFLNKRLELLTAVVFLWLPVIARIIGLQ